MKRVRRTFSREYKLAAVKKVIEQGLSYCEVARDLGIRDTLIHNWRKAFEAGGAAGSRERRLRAGFLLVAGCSILSDGRLELLAVQPSRSSTSAPSLAGIESGKSCTFLNETAKFPEEF